MNDNKKRSAALERKIDYYVDRVPYYPEKITTKPLILGWARMKGISMSQAIDQIINPFFKNMRPDEIERIKCFANKQDE